MTEPSESAGSKITEQTEFTEALLQNLPGFAYECATDDRRTMLLTRGNCEALTGYSLTAMSGNNLAWLKMIHADDREFVNTAVQTALSEGKRFDIQYRIIDKSGREKWVRERGHGVDRGAESPTVVIGYVDDISPVRDHAHTATGRLTDHVADFNSQVRSQADISRQREQLAHADRLYTLGEMATGIAHEINQPLTAISLFAQAGYRLLEAREYESLPEIFDKLSKHAHRAGAIVERIQNMARPRDPGRKFIDLNDLTKDVVDLAEMDAQTSGIAIDLVCSSEPLNVVVDVVQIQQVTLNLLRNAIDAMRSQECSNGDTIQVRTSKLEDGFMEVSVADSGGGVDSTIAESLFEPFLTTKQAGLGMGLPISNAIVTGHGGQLHHWNHNLDGATFAFSLPPAPTGDQYG